MKKVFLFFAIFILSLCVFLPNGKPVFAMPYYDLSPKKLTVRSEFSTSIATSTIERKSNIALACKFINKTFLDVNEEFSFNKVVGNRTEKRGFKTAKIIQNGKFTEGVGGGVCQVSTTLYNAVLLANLKVTEYHHHSLPVNYVKPSFDAMVNSGSADLRFINNTKNPLIIYASVTEDTLKFTIYGEPNKDKIFLESVVLESLPYKTEYIEGTQNEYPELSSTDSIITQYGKNGIISEGYVIIKRNGKTISRKRIRKDRYNPVNTIVIKCKNDEKTA